MIVGTVERWRQLTEPGPSLGCTKYELVGSSSKLIGVLHGSAIEEEERIEKESRRRKGKCRLDWNGE